MNIGMLDPMSFVVEDEEEFVKVPISEAIEKLRKSLTVILEPSRDVAGPPEHTDLLGMIGEISAKEVKVVTDMKNFNFDVFDEVE